MLMQNQNLYFNILTFDFPEKEQTFYFSKEETEYCSRIHRSLFPREIESIFPGVTTDDTQFIYSTFDYPKEGFTPLNIDFEKENQDLLRKYYNRQIRHYFKKIKNQLVKKGFIGENQVWVYSNDLSDDKFDIYYKFSLKIQFQNVSPYPEIVLSYDGKSKVFRESALSIAKKISHSLFKWVIKDNQLLKFKELVELDEPDYR